ncbi:MAG: hypothetical protein AMS23_09780 [Bacteroides sp. SM1_62]|nr:MAG: hypothetical protein AMS26_18300 [Bacteroides sp. SM23_62]KPL21137.1 MAG: hypothetical protein AMS23_09780 [Bacteroides sp. SM1_62]
MKTFHFLAIFALIVQYSCKSDKPEGKGWTSLFNGKNLDGWMVECKPEDRPKGFWTVQDSIIQVNSVGQKDHDYVWLTTQKEYADFILKLKFAAFKESPGNSGVQVRSRYDHDSSWLDGPQVDINPPEPWRTGMVWDETRGSTRWLYPDIPRGEWVNEDMRREDFDLFYSTQEDLIWNELEIRVEGLDIQSWLNGVQITDLKGEGILDDSIHRKYNVGESGFIALQLHIGDELKMYFKDIFIKEL